MRSITLYFLLLLLGTAGIGKLKAQDVPCITDEHFSQAALRNPALYKARDSMNGMIAAHFASRATVTNETVYTIPMVFHIIHNGGAENIPDLIVKNELITLNETYNKQNKDTASIRAIFKSLASNARINFVLASRDPQGNCTTGIDRVMSELTNDATDEVKNLVQWNPEKYLNVWVVASIQNNTGLSGSVAGYSTFPWLAKSDPGLDGVIMDYHFVNKNRKTLTHEVGHYLGLYHTFQDGCDGGDGIADTPPVAEANFNWNTSTNSCKNDFPDMPDMIENYMDYASFSYLFTPKQVERMRYYLLNVRGKLCSADNIALTTSACTVGIETNQATTESMSVYPNPASDNLSILTNGFPSQEARLSIFDITGKQVYAAPMEIASSGSRHNINLQDAGIGKGIYLVRINSKYNTHQSKIVVQ